MNKAERKKAIDAIEPIYPHGISKKDVENFFAIAPNEDEYRKLADAENAKGRDVYTKRCKVCGNKLVFSLPIDWTHGRWEQTCCGKPVVLEVTELRCTRIPLSSLPSSIRRNLNVEAAKNKNG